MFDKFSERHIGVSNEKDLKAMLEVIGAKSVDELISQVIPQSIRLKKPLALPAEGMSEYEFAAHIRALADRNHPLRSFIGMGYYPCAVPAAVARNVFENPAWYTSYTPYQAEISQGRLEALLNFQTAVLSLTGMEIANCSLLDEGTATAEAMLMMFALRSRDQIKNGCNQLFVDDDGEVIESVTTNRVVMGTESVKTTQTTIPFVKNNEFDYGWLTGEDSATTWLLYVLVAIFVVTAVSNGANLTDGLDGLATGVSVPIVAVLGVLAYLSGHIVYADYLNIMYIPDSGELVVFAAAFAGALVGFLWYNSFPAQIFMGDTGSLSIGGIIAVFALCIRKELLLPLLCGVFLVESFSVMMQVGYFKYTKRKYGEGQRLLLMAPVHHHFQKKGQFETKIVLRFWIISLLLAAITLVTLKIR